MQLRQRLERLEAERGANRHPLAHVPDDELIYCVCAACDAPVDEWCAVMNRKADPRAFLRKYGDAESKRLFLKGAL
jgi:hypothetical protein